MNELLECPPWTIRDANVTSLKNFLSITLASIAVALISSSAAAAYPDKPIKILVPFAPGGALDTVSRTVAQHLTAAWGQTVLVENRPGASGQIGANAVAKSPPDGYTLLATWGGFVVNPHLYPNLPFDVSKDFSPITQIVGAPLVLVVHPSVPAKNFQEFVQLVKSQPGKIAVGNGGLGTAQHMGGEYLDMTVQMKSLHVPYKGSAPATTDLLGGQLHAMLDNMVTQIPHIKSGKLRALAVTSEKRVGILPDVPTVAESGYPGFSTGTWYGLVAPAGTPTEIVDKLQTEIARIIALPAVSNPLIQLGLEPVGSTPAQYAKFMQDEYVSAGKIVKIANIKVE